MLQLSSSLEENLAALNARFGASADFYAKRIELYHCPGAIVLFDNMASLESLWSLLLDAATRHTPSLEPERMPHTGTQVYDLLMNHSGLPAEDGPVKDMDDLIRRMTAGMAVLLLDGCKKGLVFSVQGLKSRSVEEPSGEGNLRGSREGFADLHPGADYDPLYQSALCRQKADWLIGINASRLFSVLYHRTLNIGRVQTPTLAMLADRDSKIVLFRKEKYHYVRLALEGAEAVSDRIVSPEDAQAIRDACDGQRAVCVSLVREKKTEKPPKLYDLTTLQREANRVFGYTAKQTLDYAQSLYEKKLLTYPRTDSRYLTVDMTETASVVLHLAARVPPFDACPEFFPDVAALVNDKEVSDHHALIPTLELEKADVPGLPVGERNILLLVCCKLLCAAAEPFVYEAVTATFDCGGHTFTAKGKQVLSQGWRAIQEVFRSSLKEKPEDEDAEGVLPALTEGQVFEPVSASVTEHFTSPPKPYTEDTLLSAMENAGKEDMPDEAERKGLGTPATRAAIIEKLVSGGFVERKGKNLIPTKAGVNLVTVLPELLTSPKLTADWEQRLNEVAKGQASPEDFMDGIEAMAAELVRKYSHISEDGQKLFQPEKETVGLCPRCGKPVYEGKKNFACSDRACQFVMWKNDRFWTSRRKEMTRKMAADLLKKGHTSVKGMWSEKKGSTYDAVVILDDTGGKYVNFKLEFPKRKDGVHGKK